MSKQNTAEELNGELPMHKRLEPHKLVHMHQVRRTWWVTLPAGCPEELVMDPRFWSKCIPTLSIGGDTPPDRIECMPADRSWFVELMILSIGGDEVQVMKVAGGRLPEIRANMFKVGPLGTNVDDFAFENFGPGEGWAVVRKHDKHVMYKCRSQGQCAPWLSSYLATVNR